MADVADANKHGRVFRSAMSSVLASDGVFPTEPAPEVIVPSVEPSSLSVAADLAAPSEPNAECGSDCDSEGVPFLTPRASRGKWFAAAGALLVVAVGVFGAHSMGSPPPAHEAQPASHGPSVVADVPPPALDAMPLAAANVAVAGAARAVTSEPAKPRRLGKLSLRGAAAYKRVYFDGKLLLGNRARSFDVFCGEHTISIGVRNDEHEIEVPCGGEFVVAR
ncbi:hypothetical protein [Labilithrix luteola]|uniref:hypothetical protein n=1 Tax=Labilithrix luteola TaxID=1391654 RepID=UPI0011BAD106|nr:hypothetical protein [Labilithrix luteola]